MPARNFLQGVKRLQVVFEWPHIWGAILCAIIISSYSCMGGIRATIWTDSLQSVLMTVSMAILLGASLWSLGGVEQAWSRLQQLENFLNVSPDSFFIPGIGGTAIFILSWVFAGFLSLASPIL